MGRAALESPFSIVYGIYSAAVVVDQYAERIYRRFTLFGLGRGKETLPLNAVCKRELHSVQETAAELVRLNVDVIVARDSVTISNPFVASPAEPWGALATS